MSDIAPGLQAALAESPHFEFVSSHLSTLLSSYPPPFIFIHDPETVRLTASVVRSTLHELSSEPPTAESSQIKYACVNAVACFSPRILYDTALNALAGWTPDWRNGATNWHGSGAEARRYNENFDAFVHGVQAVARRLGDIGVAAQSNGASKGKGKGKAKEQEAPPNRRLVLVVERAERLKDNLPEILVPLTRLAELVSPSPTARPRRRNAKPLSPKSTSPPCSSQRCSGKTYVSLSALPPSHTTSTYPS